jgi:hypothetical protein
VAAHRRRPEAPTAASTLPAFEPEDRFLNSCDGEGIASGVLLAANLYVRAHGLGGYEAARLIADEWLRVSDPPPY